MKTEVNKGCLDQHLNQEVFYGSGLILSIKLSGNDEAVVGENVIEIRTLYDEEIVINWVTQKKISKDTIDKLFKEGFTSMEAMLLLEDEDISRTKIPRVQQKLILAAIQKLLKLMMQCAD